MNIVIITTHYPTPDPDEQYTKADHLWALAWRQAGHQVSVFHLRPRLFWKERRGQGPREYAIDGIPVFYLDYPRFIPHRGYIIKSISRQMAAAVAGRLEAAKPDVVICDFCAGNWSVIRLLKAKMAFRDTPFVPLFNNSDLNSLPRAKDIATHSSIVGARSSTIAQRLRKQAPDTPVFVAYSGAPLLDSEFVQAKIQRAATPHKVLFAGDLIPLKNVDILLQAIALLPSYAMELCIVGDGPLEHTLQAYATSANLRNVKFTGRLSRENVLERMLDSDIFVMASSPESFGMVYMEAMAAGCYAIGSQGEGIDGVIIDGQNGGLVKPRNAQALAAALEAYILLPHEQRQAILSAALQTAKAYSDEAVAKRILDDIAPYTGR